MSPKNQTKYAFISYSWDSEEHKDWVIKLAHDLRVNGVEVFHDKSDVGAGDHIGLSIEEAMKKADIIISILTPKYKLKVENRENWVGREYDLYATMELAQKTDIKIIPVLRSGIQETSVPFNLMSKAWLSMTPKDDYESGFRELISQIYPHLKPKITVGIKPKLIDDIKLGSKSIDDENAVNSSYTDFSKTTLPTLIFHGLENTGKSMAMLRLSRYLQQNHFVQVNANFSSHKRYELATTEFNEALTKPSDLITDIDPEMALCLNIKKNDRHLFQMLDIPWHDEFHFFETAAHPIYLRQLYKLKISRVNLIFLEYPVQNHPDTYLDMLTQFVLNNLIPGSDKVVIVISKCDLSHNLLKNGSPIIPRFENEFLHNKAYSPFIEVLKSKGMKTPRIIPFSSFSPDVSGDELNHQSIDYYPKALWRAINRELTGIRKSWF